MNTPVPILKLEGRSGCRLEVVSEQGIFSVRKFSKEPGYNARLLVQAEKQQRYFLQHSSDDFKTTTVLHQSGPDAALTWFEMPYLHGQHYSEFLERATVAEVNETAQKFERYFQQAIEAAHVSPANEDIFRSKIKALEELLMFRKDINQQAVLKTFQYLKRLPESEILLGFCHGDFTFSNMLFCDDGIYLVDFLDSFVDSPLIDLVKFRQDTFFYWSVLIEKLPSSRASKVIQIFNHIDSQIMNGLAGNKFVKAWYNYLQVFNLLRILPYVHNAEEITFVEKSIQRILPES